MIGERHKLAARRGLLFTDTLRITTFWSLALNSALASLDFGLDFENNDFHRIQTTSPTSEQFQMIYQ